MRILNIINRLITILTPHESLRLRTWWVLLRSGKNIRKVIAFNTRSALSDFLNKPATIFCFVILLSLTLAILNLKLTFDYSGTIFYWLNCIEVSPHFAKELITENVANTGAIVALSFVIIGFLFEVIREKTGRDLETLIRATYLYTSLSVSLVSLVYMVILNLMKESLAETALKNLAISSSYLVLIVLMLIGVQFHSLIRLFNQRRLLELSRKSITILGSRLMFSEFFTQTSKVIMNTFFERAGVLGYNYFQDSNLNRVILLSNEPRYCRDINLLLLKVSIKALPGDRNLIRYNELYVNRIFFQEDTVFYYQEGHVAFSRAFLKPSLYFTRQISIQDQYQGEREKLRNMINRCAENGDIEGLQNQLGAVEELYSIYFQTRGTDD